MDAQEVANLLWALATLDSEPGAACKRHCSTTRYTCASMNAQAVTNTLWAVATLEVEPVAEPADGAARPRGACGSRHDPAEVANTFWALATLEVEPNGGLQAALLGRAVQ